MAKKKTTKKAGSTMANEATVGILVHGRHMQTQELERLIWGEPPRQLGSLPMMVFVALTRGIETVAKVVFGTGASKRGGLFESQYMKKFLQDHFEELAEFEQIADHDDYPKKKGDIEKLLKDIFPETKSNNTKSEIKAAADIFKGEGVTEVIHITCASHAPRCMVLAAKAFEDGDIPDDQVWSVVRDMTTYSGTKAEDVKVFEPPHRGDDQMIGAPLQPHQVFGRYPHGASRSRKIALLEQIDKVFNDNGVD